MPDTVGQFAVSSDFSAPAGRNRCAATGSRMVEFFEHLNKPCQNGMLLKLRDNDTRWHIVCFSVGCRRCRMSLKDDGFKDL
jgi:hypothetical protein